MRTLVALHSFDPTRPLGGTTYVRGVLGGLARSYATEVSVLCSSKSEAFVREAGPGLEVVSGGQIAESLPRLAGEMVAVRQAREATRCDVVFYPLNLMAPMCGLGVVMVHDLVDRFYRRELREWMRVRYVARELAVSSSIRRASIVVTPTESVKAEIVGSGLKPVEAVVAAHEGIEGGWARGEGGGAMPERRYYVQPAGYNPHKNVLGAISGWQEYGKGRGGAEVPLLVVTGIEGRYRDECEGHAQRLGISSSIRLMPRLSGEQYRELVQGAQGIVVPSLYEGFGLPVAEALRNGIPLMAADIPALRESSGGHAVFFNPRDASSIARALGEMERRPTKQTAMSEAGLQWATALSWTRHCGKVMDACREAVRRKERVRA